ncbi:hypothetical protein OIU78_025440 [Salix suchowensis]|nr:hypothetical protein OIU78_025440 [Salix suchowensis]
MMKGVDDAKVTDKKCWDEKEKRFLSAFLVLKGAGKCDDSRKELTIQEGQQEEDVIGIDSCDLMETPEMKSSMEEIQVVEFNFDRIVSVEENSGTESRMDLLGCDWRKMEVEEDKSGVLACEKYRSRRSKIRRKIIKKLVPKKLRAIKKAKKSKEKEPDAGSESSSCWGDDEMGIIKVLEDGGKQGFESKGKTLLSKLLEEDDDDDDEPDQGYSSSSSGWQAEMESGKVFFTSDEQFRPLSLGFQLEFKSAIYSCQPPEQQKCSAQVHGAYHFRPRPITLS